MKKLIAFLLIEVMLSSCATIHATKGCKRGVDPGCPKFSDMPSKQHPVRVRR